MHQLLTWLYQTKAWSEQHQASASSGIDYFDYEEYHALDLEKTYFMDDIDWPYERLPDHHNKIGKCAYASRLLRLDATKLLPYLINSLQQNNVKLMKSKIDSVDDEIRSPFDCIINCTGDKVTRLIEDNEAFPMLGHFILLEKCNLNTRKLQYYDEQRYLAVIPRSQAIWLGGSAYSHCWNNSHSDNIFDAILNDCIALEPEIKDQQVIKKGFGLRSARSSIRLEGQRLGNKTWIHNYGHGGSAFSLFWGCANAKLSLVKTL